MTATPATIAHHLDAYRADGRPAKRPMGGFADELWADFSPQYAPNGDTLAAARAHAEHLFATIAQVAFVDIRESVQEYEGGMWKAGRHVERIERGDRPGPTITVRPVVDAHDETVWEIVGPNAYGTYLSKAHAEAAAARLSDTSAVTR